MEVFSNRADPQTAPPVDRCPRCGGEIYQREELALGRGLCANCYARLPREPARTATQGG